MHYHTAFVGSNKIIAYVTFYYCYPPGGKASARLKASLVQKLC